VGGVAVSFPANSGAFPRFSSTNMDRAISLTVALARRVATEIKLLYSDHAVRPVVTLRKVLGLSTGDADASCRFIVRTGGLEAQRRIANGRSGDPALC
jgi:hypothetical protein